MRIICCTDTSNEFSAPPATSIPHNLHVDAVESFFKIDNYTKDANLNVASGSRAETSLHLHQSTEESTLLGGVAKPKVPLGPESCILRIRGTTKRDRFVG